MEHVPDTTRGRSADDGWRGRAVRRQLGMLLLVGVAGSWIAGTACQGSRIRAEFVPNHPADFDFRRPPCLPDPAPQAAEDEVLLRYLGVSGIWIGWRGSSLMTAPFFSDYSSLHAGLRSVKWDMERIRRGMDGVPSGIDTVLVGHSHYDHLGDLPPVAAGWAEGAELWVNRSGANMLAGCPELEGNRRRVLEEVEGRWVRPTTPAGDELPFRVMALRSGHAAHLWGLRFAHGEVETPWSDCIEGHKIRRLLDGTTYTFLVDLLDEQGRVAFRLHFQDAGSDAPLGFPPAEAIAERPVDLAVTCMPSWYKVHGYPAGLIDAAHARHVLVTHYEDFIGEDSTLRFVPLLTNGRANGFMRVVRDTMADHQKTGPLAPSCGPSGDAWSMPLPGEWLRFRAAVE